MSSSVDGSEGTRTIRPPPPILCGAAALALSLACSSTVDPIGAGAGGDGSSGGGGSSLVAAERADANHRGAAGATMSSNDCATDTTAPPIVGEPHPVKFRITSSATETVFAHYQCTLVHTLLSCEQGTHVQLQLHGACTSECGSEVCSFECGRDHDCVGCGGCESSIAPLAVDAPVIEHDWDGTTFAFVDATDDCVCHERENAPAGKYRLEVPVFESHEAALGGNVLRLVQVEFELPAPGGIVEVDVAR